MLTRSTAGRAVSVTELPRRALRAVGAQGALAAGLTFSTAAFLDETGHSRSTSNEEANLHAKSSQP